MDSSWKIKPIVATFYTTHLHVFGLYIHYDEVYHLL